MQGQGVRDGDRTFRGILKPDFALFSTGDAAAIDAPATPERVLMALAGTAGQPPHTT